MMAGLGTSCSMRRPGGNSWTRVGCVPRNIAEPSARWTRGRAAWPKPRLGTAVAHQEIFATVTMNLLHPCDDVPQKRLHECKLVAAMLTTTWFIGRSPGMF